MTEELLRRWMLAVAAWMAVGTLGELVLAEHLETPVQAIPFVLLGFGLAAIGAAVVAPSSRTLRALRGVAAVLIAGSAVGLWEHLEHNYAFEQEIRPGAPTVGLVGEALFGASPLLAPGVIAVIGVLAAAATLRDPRLG